MHTAQAFPRFSTDEDNNKLQQAVSPMELEIVLHWFNKIKSRSLNGWTIEFFLGFYELIGRDLLNVLEESHTFGQMYNAFNSTLFSLILKFDAPSFANY